MFAYPACGQWITDRTDGRIFMRLWQALWCLLIFQVVMSHLLNRKNGIHSRHVGARQWLPGRNWPVVALAVAAYFFIMPAMSGLGTFLFVSPACYIASNLIVELRMRHPLTDVSDAQIAGRYFQRRIGG